MAKKRIGIHLSTSGGVFRAAERAHAIGANTFQIFSSSPRMWKAQQLEASHCEQMRRLRKEYDCFPLAIHKPKPPKPQPSSQQRFFKSNDYFEARYYASSTGRFLSPDWSAKVEPVPYAKLDNPQSLNLYAYLGNNPLGGVDSDHYRHG